MTRGEIRLLRGLVSKIARGTRSSGLRYNQWEIVDVHDTLLARMDDENEADLFESLTNNVLDDLLDLAEEAIDAEDEIRAAGHTSLGDLIEELQEERRSAVDRLADLADA